MIEYINGQLNTWAQWVIGGRRVVGLGFPSQSSYTRLMARGGESRGAEFDEESWQMEQAIQRLSQHDRTLVMAFYLATTTVAMVARDMRCSRDTIYTRLHSIHHHLLGHLNDIAADS